MTRRTLSAPLPLATLDPAKLMPRADRWQRYTALRLAAAALSRQPARTNRCCSLPRALPFAGQRRNWGVIPGIDVECRPPRPGPCPPVIRVCSEEWPDKRSDPPDISLKIRRMARITRLPPTMLPLPFRGTPINGRARPRPARPRSHPTRLAPHARHARTAPHNLLAPRRA